MSWRLKTESRAKSESLKKNPCRGGVSSFCRQKGRPHLAFPGRSVNHSGDNPKGIARQHVWLA